jgi:hypothetical protein
MQTLPGSLMVRTEISQRLISRLEELGKKLEVIPVRYL